MKKKNPFSNFQQLVKKNRTFLLISTHIIVYFLSQREDLLKAYDLFILFEIMAILEALYIIFNIFKKFLETFLSVTAMA